jgi:hypothetical protein
MSAMELMHFIESRPYAMAIAQSRWLFPGLETVHVFTLTLVVGSVALIDLRLVGVSFRERSVRELCSSVLPWTWGAFAVAATCGALLFSSKASLYFVNVPFRLKMLCLLLAAVNMIVFHAVTARGLADWEHGPPPLAARLAGAVSLLLWITIVAAGRWIGFTT